MDVMADKHEAQPNVDEMMSDEACDQHNDHGNTGSAQDRVNSMKPVTFFFFLNIDWLQLLRIYG